MFSIVPILVKLERIAMIIVINISKGSNYAVNKSLWLDLKTMAATLPEGRCPSE